MEGRQFRIVYMGTPWFAVAPLRRLVESGYNIVSVVTAPDKSSGRGLKLTPSPVKEYALSVGLPVMQPEKLKAEDFIASFRSLNADLGIVIAFRMLPEVIWSAPRLGTFNLHASLLPQYRGAAPINRVIINGETVTGVTTFMLNSEIDKGDVLGRREVLIEPEDNAGTLHDKLMFAGCELVIDSIEAIAAGKVIPLPQSVADESLLKPAPKIFREDCRIEWRMNGVDIINLIRGLSPYPTAWCELSLGEKPQQVKVFKAIFEPATHGRTPGELFSDGRNYIKITCPDGYICLEELQLAGKRRMRVYECLRGVRFNSKLKK
jgi:methionyl-tRNA formyltransferase